MTLAAAALACAVWLYLLVARGGFWLARDRDDAGPPIPKHEPAWPRVVAIVPARDEAPVIGETLRALLRQDYRGSFRVIVVDDHSGDGTAEAARRAASAAGASSRVAVVAAAGLPDGWTGKLWAVHHGIGQAEAMSERPEYLLLTDADIRCADDTLTTLMRRALASDLTLVSMMAKLRCVSFAEHALIPAFVFFFQMLYPFAWVRSADLRTAAAAGGCMLVRRRALIDAGGIEAIRSELIDDCALARLLKRRGPIWLGLTKRVESVRDYASVADVGRMVVRSAYAQLGFRPFALAATAIAMIVTFLAPPLLTFFGSGIAQVIGALAWALMTLAYLPTLRFYNVSPAWALALPAIAAAYLWFTVESAWQHARQRGGAWKGRIYGGTSIGR